MSAPNAFLLDEQDGPAVENYLRSAGWLEPGEEFLDVKRAGQGNMNYVVRVRTGQRSFILKQSRPWVEKYPHIPAPWDRTLVEAEFYKTVQHCDAVAASMPRLLGFDATAHVLQISDLGDSPTFEFLYAGEAFRPAELARLTAYLSNLHATFRHQSLCDRFANTDMRGLNHEHIFCLPFRSGNGLDLDSITPGLANLAHQFQTDLALHKRVEALSKIYLGDGECLLHGDFFPGSWMRINDGVRIIDPEFCFFGRPEFDWGVLLAHLRLCHLPAELPASGSLNRSLLNGFAGVEMIRRLIGVAQLPLQYGLREKELLLRQAQYLLHAFA